jgi:hypothetical protein
VIDAVVLDEDERAVIECLRKMRKHGYGRIEIVVVSDEIERITPSPVFNKRAGDFARIGDFSVAVGVGLDK